MSRGGFRQNAGRPKGAKNTRPPYIAPAMQGAPFPGIVVEKQSTIHGRCLPANRHFMRLMG